MLQAANVARQQAAAPRRRLGALGVVALASLTTACASLPDKQIAKTGAALGNVEATFREAYLSLNENRREAFIRAKVYGKDPIVIGDPVIQGSVYSDEAIEARLTALDAVARYAELLDAYANGGHAEDVGEAASGFVGSAFALQARVAGTGSDYAGPVSNLVGLVSTWATDAYLKKELKKNLPAATRQVVAILDLLERDAKNVLQPGDVINAKSQFAALLNNYNDNAGRLSLAERERMADLLIEAAAMRDAAQNPQLAPVIAAAKKAVLALDKRIQSGNDPNDVKAATAALQEFSSRVKALAETLKALRAAKG